MTNFYAIDCEMVALIGHRSGLARVCVMDNNEKIHLNQFCYQDPEYVLDYRSHISGITKEHLSDAPAFETIRQNVIDIIKNNCIVGHSIDNDLRALQIMLPPEQVIDVADIPLFRAGKNRRKLKDLAKEYLGLSIQEGIHDPIEDAQAALKLFLWYSNRKQTS